MRTYTILAIVLVAVLAVAAAFVVLSDDDDSDRRSGSDSTYNAGFRMESSAAWYDSSDVRHDVKYTFRVMERTSSFLEGAIDIVSDGDKATSSVNITKQSGTRYVANIDGLDELASVRNLSGLWIFSDDEYATAYDESRVIDLLFELAITGYASVGIGSLGVNPIELARGNATWAEKLISQTRVHFGLDMISEMTDSDGKFYPYVILTSDGAIRSDDESIFNVTSGFNTYRVCTLRTGGHTFDVIAQHSRDADDRTFTIDGTLLLSAVNLNEHVVYSIDSIYYT